MRFFISFAFSFALLVCSADAQCKGRKDGYYPYGNQCDAYVKCESGRVSEQALCEDGLVFNQYADPKNRNCQLPFNVDCSDRPALQPAQPTEECARQFTMLGQCQKFIQCNHGKSSQLDCPEGLVFNDRAGVCDWPDQVPECRMEEHFGFTCPEPEEDQIVRFGDHARYAHPTESDRYYVCMRTNANGDRNLSPRLLFCGASTTFDYTQLSCQPTASSDRN